jgi:ribonucleoside-triphosphate reductase (thioredoxin)
MSNHLPTQYQQFIALSRYARWIPDEARRETFVETVERYMANVVRRVIRDEAIIDSIQDAILSLSIMPSMRMMMTAGPALDRDNTAGYNCAYVAVDDPKAFDESMMILLCGTGVGFSVERQHIAKMPEVPEKLFPSEDTIVVHDSKEGWAKAYRKLVAMLYAGEIPRWNTSKVRPSGAKLRTFGGRASGPEPLIDLFRFTIDVFKRAIGRRLSSIECHDIMCKIGDVVVVGGVRRSAMISLSNLSDDRMRHAKSGQWWEGNAQRALANNSAVYTEKPDIESFLREWTALVESKSGERGIFARYAAEAHVARSGRRETGHDWGTNPCSEIILRSNQFCNLTEAVVRFGDTRKTLEDKVRLATILGTIQSTFTKFPYLRRIWTKNTEEERLLGVSLTGIMDNPLTSDPDPEMLTSLQKIAVETNKEWADRLGIPASAAITCVKPSGTVSQLVDAGSGIHARHSPYYIRTVRGDVKDPLTTLMIASGVPNEPEVFHPDSTVVFSFPVRSPAGAVTRNDMTALQQLELWKTYALHWCEHKPSVTISVRDEEWIDVGAWVYRNFDICSGISFLPHADHTYQQAPYQECDEDTYNDLLGRMPQNIDWTLLGLYEKDDTTSGMQTLACSGGVCELSILPETDGVANKLPSVATTVALTITKSTA